MGRAAEFANFGKVLVDAPGLEFENRRYVVCCDCATLLAIGRDIATAPVDLSEAEAKVYWVDAETDDPADDEFLRPRACAHRHSRAACRCNQSKRSAKAGGMLASDWRSTTC